MVENHVCGECDCAYVCVEICCGDSTLVETKTNVISVLIIESVRTVITRTVAQVFVLGELQPRNCSNVRSCGNATVGFLASDLVPRMTL